MKAFLLLLLTVLPIPLCAQNANVTLPAKLNAQYVDPAIPTIARDALLKYRDEDRARYLGTLFRLQVAAGDYAQAVESIEAVRKLRGDSPSQPPLYLQYEVYARARNMQVRQGKSFEKSWSEIFARTFGALENKVALQTEFSFGGYLPRMRADLDAALAKVAGKQSLPLPDAIDLIRAWQVYTSYAAFQPLFETALKEDDARRYALDRNALVRTKDDASISTLVVRPAKAPPLPTLMTFTIYANDDWAWADAKKMAAYGYAGVVAYTRGKGRSTDTIVPFEHDGADAAAVIDWIAMQPWSDGRVGMFGGSYSGFTQWAALKHRPKALKAIAASATTAPGIDVPMEGGVYLNFMYPWPQYTTGNRSLDDASYGDAARWGALNRKWYASGRAYRDLPSIDGVANPVFEKWLAHPSYDPYWQAMIPQGDEFSGIDIPVLTTTGYFDGAQIGALHYFREHLRHRPDADHTMLIGPYEHFTMQTGVPQTVQGYSPDPSARLDLQALRLEWFDHIFKGSPKPAVLADRVNWQVMGADKWRHAHKLATMASRTQKLYLVPGDDKGANALSMRAQPKAAVLQRVDFKDRSDADWTQPPSVINTALDPHLDLVFVGEPVLSDVELAGPFSGVLDFTVNKQDVDLAIGIYELNKAGEYLDLAFWLQRASAASDQSARRLLKSGKTHRIVVKDTRLIGRKLAAGSRIVVTIGIIKQPGRQLNLGSGKSPIDETAADAGAPMELRVRGSSYLEFGFRE